MAVVFFRQVKVHGDNFSYIVADPSTREAAVVDSSYNADELVRILKAENFVLKYIINTHGHVDHTAGNFVLRSALGGQVVVHSCSTVRGDVKVADGDVLYVGCVAIEVVFTPGHTPDGICLLVDGVKLLTGDTLFVGECGRTDLPGGSAECLFDSLFGKLLGFGDGVEVYPGHDYGVKRVSTIGEERRTNYVLKPRRLAEFVAFMGQP